MLFISQIRVDKNQVGADNDLPAVMSTFLVIWGKQWPDITSRACASDFKQCSNQLELHVYLFHYNLYVNLGDNDQI